ncbi:alanine--tRNA ligase, partial [Candidatus Falkowbacteria bacterium]|nr:alanine--tRNA ligase [Candidatus Falkowbacteria bacterium]
LGNWSLGDYWKKEAITWSFEFLTKELKIPVSQLAVSCFVGEPENKIDKDIESAQIWQSLGIPAERIEFLGRKENWWGPAGQTGPCGPDTEMFYWTGKATAPAEFNPEDKYWVEIWNDVFMQYNKTADGEYTPLKQKNVDTGMGLERTVAVLNGKDNVFATDLFQPIIKEINKLSSSDDQKSIRIIADHLRAATFILGDEKGIVPSNLDQGYILRRLIRRAVRRGKMIGITKPFTFAIAEVIIKEYKDIYPELQDNKDFIIEQLIQEEEKFSRTLERGLKEFEKMKPKLINTPDLPSLKSKKSGFVDVHNLNGDDLFNLYATYGFPIELSLEEIKKIYKEFNVGKVDGLVELPEDVEERLIKQFHESLQKHQDLSRTASAGKFQGGLADHSIETTRLHTANHLTLAALRKVLGDHVFQKGSNITKDRLRFDFSHPEKLTPEQINQVEDLVNQKIKQALPVSWEELSLEDAKKQNAMGVFEHKYASKVKVYTIGDAQNPFSREICGGPHVKNTSELGHFKIKKEEATSAGVRRIKAVLE